MYVKDAFWWIYESKWQPNAGDQQKLFRRITLNFVNLLTLVKHPHYEETFIKVIFRPGMYDLISLNILFLLLFFLG